MCFQIVDDVPRRDRHRRRAGQAGRQRLLEGVYTLPVIYALADDPGLAERLGGPLDGERLAEVRQRAAANGAVEAALAVASDHATKAAEALAGADTLDPRVCESLRRLVEGLVERQS